jgi:ABC-2 type transport system permease protein
MNARSIKTLMLKDLKEVAQNQGAWVPAVVVPFIFLLLLPLGVIIIPQMVPGFEQWLATPDGLPAIQKYIGPFMGDALAGLTPIQTIIVMVTGYMLAPFLLIMPLMLSTIVGAESFVGERERKTLEALIYTPATDGELFVGKVAACVLPAVVLSWLSFVVYGLVVNIASYPVMGRIWFPPASWWPLMLWLVPAIATLGMAVSVLISIKVRTFMEAYQMSGSLVVVVLALVAGQMSGVLFLTAGVILLLGLAVWLIDAVLIWLGIRTFNRTSLLSRL